jgi:hypothetical protein
MKIAARLAAVLALGVGASGCLGIDMVVKVKGDGSGTVEKSITMNPQALQEMKSEMEAAGFKETKEGKKPEPEKSPMEMTDKELLEGPFDPEALKKEAAGMGPGVTFVSATPIRQPDKMGVKAVFAFKDVNTLKLNQKPAGAPAGEAKASPEDELKFALGKAPSGNALLKVRSSGFAKGKSSPKPKETPPPGMDKMAEGMMQMMKTMLKGLRITIGVEVDGPVVKTNSPYVSGSRVTYMDLEFDKLLADEKALKAFDDMEGSLEEQKAALSKVKGMKVHLEPEMLVEFKAN